MNNTICSVCNDTLPWFDGETERNLLLKLNEQKVRSSILVLCVISVIILLGTLGNLLVLATYLKQINKNSTNFFIFCLAIFDLTSCVVALPVEMAALLQPLTYEYPWLCKLHKFIAFSADLASGYTIVCISFDRYLRIARPHKRFSRRTCRRAVVFVVCISVLVSSMALFVYGSEKVVSVLDHRELVGHKCGIDEVAEETVIPLVFISVILAAFVIGVIILLTVYIRLGILVRRWNKGRIKSAGNRRFPKSVGTSDDSSSKCENKSQKFRTEIYPYQVPLLAKDISLLKSKSKGGVSDFMNVNVTKSGYNDAVTQDNEVNAEKVKATEQTLTDNEISETEENSVASLPIVRPGIVKEMTRSLEKNGFKIPDPSVHFDGTATLPLRKMSSAQREQNKRKVGTRKKSLVVISDLKKRMTLSKTTTMFIVATFAFVACHVPYVCVKVALVTVPDLEDSLTLTQTVFYRLAEYSFTVSSCVNPLIYSFLNPRFRSECRTLIVAILKKVNCKI